jgi:hypothetical protein
MRKKLTSEERLEHHREADRKWKKAHPDKCLEQARRRHAINPERYREEARRRYAANPEHYREQARLWRKAHPEKKMEWERNWREAHPKELRAEWKANHQVPLADTCELCGAKAQHRHHPDYSKPLLVIHLCARCHKQIHACKHLLFSNV